MIKLTSLEAVFAQVHNAVKSDTLLAGGAIRDYLSNKSSYKDIDVFIQSETVYEFEEKCSNLESFFGKGKTLSKEQIETPKEYRENPSIVKVKTFQCRFGTELQIVGVRNTLSDFPQSVFKSFDFAINCCGLNETGIIDTPQAQADRVNQTFTLQNVWSPNQLIKLIDKYKRLTEQKYAGYQLAYIPEAFH